MTGSRRWYCPGISFTTYAKKYPFVLAASAFAAFGWCFQLTPWLYAQNSYSFNDLYDYSPLANSFITAIALFALLHLAFQSPWFENFKYRSVVYALGLLFLTGTYIYFADVDENNTVLIYDHLLLVLGLAAFLMPVAGREVTARKFWAYTVTLVRDLVVVVFIDLLISWVLHLIFTSNQLPTFLDQWVHYLRPVPEQLVGFVLIPWYLLGSVERFWNGLSESEQDQPPLNAGMTVLFGFALAGAYLYEYASVVQVQLNLIRGKAVYAASRSHFTNNEGFFLFIFALLSVGLASLWRTEKNNWLKFYPKVTAGLCLPLWFFVVCYGVIPPAPKTISAMPLVFYEPQIYSCLFLAWIGCVLIYFLFKQEPEFFKPVLGLLIFLILTLQGPLSPKSLAFRSIKNRLETNLIAAGMWRDGQVVKPEKNMDRIAYAFILGDLDQIAGEQGLKQVKDWFPQIDLTSLRGEAGYSYNSEMVLLSLVGVGNPDNYRNFEQHRQVGFGVLESPILDIGGYQEEQRINLQQGIKNLSASEGVEKYWLSLDEAGRMATLTYGAETLAEFPISNLMPVISKYDHGDRLRRSIPSDQLVTRFENKKVKLKIYWDGIWAEEWKTGLKIRRGEGQLLVKRKVGQK